MKAAASLLLLLPLLAAPVEARAQGNDIRVSVSDTDSPGRVGSRRHPRDARLAIATRDDRVALLLTGEAVVMQLTDRGLRDIRDDMRREAEEEGESGFFAEMVQTVVRSTVESMLRRSIEYPVGELRDVEYRRGRLVFTGEDGKRVFENVRVNDTEVMESFSDADARAFVREFRRLKAAGR